MFLPTFFWWLVLLPKIVNGEVVIDYLAWAVDDAFSDGILQQGR